MLGLGEEPRSSFPSEKKASVLSSLRFFIFGARRTNLPGGKGGWEGSDSDVRNENLTGPKFYNLGL